MKESFPIIFTLLILSSFQCQAQVKERTLSLNYYDEISCWAKDVEVSLPFFELKNDSIARAMNDSISAILISCIGEDLCIDFQVEAWEGCDPTNVIPERRNIEFEQYTSEEVLSVAINYTGEAGGNGMRSEWNRYYFNLDLQREEWITFQDLFEPNQFSALEKYIQGRLNEDHLELGIDTALRDLFLGQKANAVHATTFLGCYVTDDYLRLDFRFNSWYGRYDSHIVHLELKALEPYLNEKFKQLAEDD